MRQCDLTDDSGEVEDGPIQPEDPEKVPKEPYPLIEGFEWVTMDMNDKSEVYIKPGYSVRRTLTACDR